MTHTELLRLVHYNPDTGVFHALVQRGRVPAGSIIGNRHCNGYRQFAINGQMYLAHRVAFFYMTGRWPTEVDHINGDRADNSWSNLRDATKSQNNYNKRAQPRNQSGFKGVSWNKKRRKWYAFIKEGQTQRYLGSFDKPEDAHAAYVEAANKYHGEFARTA